MFCGQPITTITKKCKFNNTRCHVYFRNMDAINSFVVYVVRTSISLQLQTKSWRTPLKKICKGCYLAWRIRSASNGRILPWQQKNHPAVRSFWIYQAHMFGRIIIGKNNMNARGGANYVRYLLIIHFTDGI